MIYLLYNFFLILIVLDSNCAYSIIVNKIINKHNKTENERYFN